MISTDTCVATSDGDKLGIYSALGIVILCWRRIPMISWVCTM